MKYLPSKQLFIKEFSSYFKNPLGYVFMVIFLFGVGYLAFEHGRGSFFYMRKASMDALFMHIPWMFIFLIPAVSMKLWSEERKSGTIELLLTMPITIPQAVLAKFLASWAFIGISIIGTFPMILTVIYLGNPDLGIIFTSYLASFLMAGSLLAVGSFFSALTKNQVICFILTACTSFLFIMAGSPPVLEFLNTFLAKYFIDLFESLSVLNHFDSMRRGVINLSNIWFFFIMISCWLYGSVIVIRENRAH